MATDCNPEDLAMWWIVLLLLWLCYMRHRNRAYHHPENATYAMTVKAWRLGYRAALIAWLLLLWPGCAAQFSALSQCASLPYETLPQRRSAQRIDAISVSSLVPSWSEKTTDGSKP